MKKILYLIDGMTINPFNWYWNPQMPSVFTNLLAPYPGATLTRLISTYEGCNFPGISGCDVNTGNWGGSPTTTISEKREMMLRQRYLLCTNTNRKGNNKQKNNTPMTPLKTILLLLLSAFINIVSAQTKEPKLFTLCGETNDTIRMADLDNCAELIPVNDKMKVVLFTITIRHGSTFEDFDPNVGGKIDKDFITQLKNTKNLNYIQVRDIVAKEGKTQKKYKGFTVYINQQK